MNKSCGQESSILRYPIATELGLLSPMDPDPPTQRPGIAVHCSLLTGKGPRDRTSGYAGKR